MKPKFRLKDWQNSVDKNGKPIKYALWLDDETDITMHNTQDITILLDKTTKEEFFYCLKNPAERQGYICIKYSDFDWSEKEESKPDYIAEITEMMKKQHDKGIKKYGETLEENTTLCMTQRIEHLQEEMIDGLQYCQHIKALFDDNLTVNDYQRMAMRTAGDKSENYLDNAIMGLAGEVGECADIVKKYKFHGHKLDKEHLIEELGDVAWYVALLASALDMSLQDVLQKNIDKLKKRYPEGFDKARSINREENK